MGMVVEPKTNTRFITTESDVVPMSYPHFQNNTAEHLVYETPTNEHLRVCLRFEYLMQQLEHRLKSEDIHATHASIIALIEIVNLLDRPDFKTKITQELKRLQSSFLKLQESENINQQKLLITLDELQYSIDYLNSISGKILQTLRDHEFLNNIRQHLLNPGGTCHFDIPIYHYWLHTVSESRDRYLQQWLREIQPFKQTSELLLMLVRTSQNFKTVQAERGFFQMNLEPNMPAQLIQVALIQHLPVFPEVSVGRHRLCVRFLESNLNSRPLQTDMDLSFELKCCFL